MTATPRLYTARSRARLAERGVEVVDMGDYGVYGPELHRLAFSKAVEHRMLSDYRVIVLGVSQGSVTPGLRRRLEDLDTSAERGQVPTTNEPCALYGNLLGGRASATERRAGGGAQWGTPRA